MSKPHPLFDFELRVVLIPGQTEFCTERPEFSLQEARWPAALDLAREYCWEPAGPLAPESDAENWPGGYAEPWGQRMEHSDACRFADALAVRDGTPGSWDVDGA